MSDPSTERRQAPGAEQPKRRRVLETPAKDTQGRSGCLITGAILGIIVGATFAFYGLPPILKHFYGEKHIAVGQTYEGDAKTIRVLSRESGSIVLEVRTNKTWAPRPGDFSLQYKGAGDWQQATAATFTDGAPAVFDIPELGETMRVTLMFPPPPSAGAQAQYLHIADPRVRFDLQ